eukprot:SAG11_NODE_8920_length_961_cov_52.627610_2_plen_119_part_01
MEAEPEEETKQLYYVEFDGFSGGIIVNAFSEQDAIEKVADRRHGLTIDIDIAEPITVTMRGTTGTLTFLGDQNLTVDEVETILNESEKEVLGKGGKKISKGATCYLNSEVKIFVDKKLA